MQIKIDDLARGQYGLVTRAQGIALGLSERQIDYRLRTGAWIRRHSGVYQVRSTAPSWESRLLAAVLTTGGVASHRCAAALWHLDVYERPKPEITVESGRWQGSKDLLVHRSTQWDQVDEITKRGIPCTGVQRTILDCGAVASLRTVERLAEAAIRRDLTTWLGLADCLSAHSRRGRDGCLKLRRLLQLRIGKGTIPLSDFSRRVTNLLTAQGVPEPVLEYRICDEAGDLILQADLAWPHLKKAWELDGLRYHFGRVEVERDRRKRNRAKAQGWNIQEILWSMYVDDPDGLVEMADRFLRS